MQIDKADTQRPGEGWHHTALHAVVAAIFAELYVQSLCLNEKMPVL